MKEVHTVEELFIGLIYVGAFMLVLSLMGWLAERK